MGPVTAYLGLGSNLGQRETNLAQAMKLLAVHSRVEVVRCSSLYETTPWGITNQPNFLNCVLEIETTLSPLSLLAEAKHIENEVGRVDNFRWGPRLIDVDILLYGDQMVKLDNPDLEIPHARLAQRAFVLVPLAELAEDVVHPGLKVTIAELTQEVEGKEGVKLWGPPIDASVS